MNEIDMNNFISNLARKESPISPEQDKIGAEWENEGEGQGDDQDGPGQRTAADMSGKEHPRDTSSRSPQQAEKIEKTHRKRKKDNSRMSSKESNSKNSATSPETTNAINTSTGMGISSTPPAADALSARQEPGEKDIFAMFSEKEPEKERQRRNRGVKKLIERDSSPLPGADEQDSRFVNSSEDSSEEEEDGEMVRKGRTLLRSPIRLSSR
jgi:hypothetical protein